MRENPLIVVTGVGTEEADHRGSESHTQRRLNLRVPVNWGLRKKRRKPRSNPNVAPTKLARLEGRAKLRIAAAEDTQARIQRILDTLPEAG